MKKILIILLSISVISIFGVYSCNSAKGISKNNEGLDQELVFVKK